MDRIRPAFGMMLLVLSAWQAGTADLAAAQPAASRPLGSVVPIPTVTELFAATPATAYPQPIVLTAAATTQPIAPPPPLTTQFAPPASPPILVAPQRVAPQPIAPYGRRPVAPLVYDGTPSGKPLARGWGWEVLPVESLFREYLADPKAARFAAQILHDTDNGWLWELRAGGRAPLLRFGTPSGTVGPSGRPEGWQIGVEGVATPRLNFEQELDLDYVDYRVGVPIQYQAGRWQYKLEPYHLSSHAGDELLVRDPTFVRINYLRDALRFGVGYFATPDLRLYGETEWAWNVGGGADPWHFQFGFDYSPVAATPHLSMPQPFLAANVGLREELDFGGGVNLIGGLQWRGLRSDNVFRAGVQYYNGKSFQYEQFDEHEELLGLGIWYDF